MDTEQTYECKSLLDLCNSCDGYHPWTTLCLPRGHLYSEQYSDEKIIEPSKEAASRKIEIIFISKALEIWNKYIILQKSFNLSLDNKFIKGVKSKANILVEQDRFGIFDRIAFSTSIGLLWVFKFLVLIPTYVIACIFCFLYAIMVQAFLILIGYIIYVGIINVGWWMSSIVPIFIIWSILHVIVRRVELPNKESCGGPYR